MKKCKVCGEKFRPKYNSMQKVCSVDCARDHARLERENEYRKETRRRKRHLNDTDRQYQLGQAEKACNEYIRLRDKDKPCISCGRHHSGQYHAGHYRSKGAMSGLRFHEANIHKQCMPCNTHKSGNITEYRINLVKKIGVEMVEFLEKDHPPLKIDLDEIKEIRQYYKDKIKELKNG